MYRKKLLEDLYNKVPENSKIVIFGACPTGEKIKNDLQKLKPDSKVIGFIDNSISGSFCGLPVKNLKDAVELKDKYDLIIMSTKTDENKIINIFDIYDIPVIPQTSFVSDYYRNSLTILNDDNISKVLDILETPEDKELYKLIINIRKSTLDTTAIEEFFFKNVSAKYHTYWVLKKHYLEKINKQAVKILFDVGLNDGLNAIAYNKLLINTQKIYGFEAIYDYTRTQYIEVFILNDKLEIVPFALGDSCKKIKFCINKTNMGASFAEEITGRKCPENSPNWEVRIVEVTTMDKFCRDRNVLPDFIKMDIEGAELSALKGGIETIKKCRPQLAISIYHSSEDFVNIPLYLKDNLKNYHYALGHYSPTLSETVLYAIPSELA